MSPADVLEPISLEELDASAPLRDRVDRKYVVPAAVAAELCRRLAPSHRTLDIDGRRAFAYVSSYYDTPDLRCLRDHLQGRRRRFKCRTRQYVDADMRRFEVKLKAGGGRTVKHRLPVTDDVLGPEGLTFLRERLADAYGELPLAARGELRTAVVVDCSRTTLVEPEAGERLTLDWALDFRAPDGRHGRMAPGWVVLESKSVGPDATADRVLRRLGARPVGMCSKYGLAIALTRPGLRPAALRPLLREAFIPTPRGTA